MSKCGSETNSSGSLFIKLNGNLVFGFPLGTKEQSN